MKTWMITAPCEKVNKKMIAILIRKNDCKKWIVAREKGINGLEHWQIRVQSSNKAFWDWMHDTIPQAHVEEATDTWDYERKEGRFWTSEDTTEIRALRFGKLTESQRRIVNSLRTQSDREVDVVYDPIGNSGKSWLCGHLWETKKACYVPPTLGTPKDIIQWVHSAYQNEGIIIIDIPRTWKWTEALYTAIEAVKDGLVYDPRYTAKMRNIRGVKILILTNERPKLDRLSMDRWRIRDSGGSPLS